MSDAAGDNRRIAKNTILLYARSVLLLAMNLYMSRVALQALGVSDYGIYQVVGGVVAMFSMLSSTMTSASQRFITYAIGKGNAEELRKTFSTCVSIHIAIGAIIVVLLEILGIWFLRTQLNIPDGRMGIAEWVMHFSIATFFVNIISVPYNSAIIAHERMTAFAYFTLLEGGLRLGSVLLLLLLSGDRLFYYALFFFCIAVVIRLLYSLYCKAHFDEAKKLILKIDRSLFRQMFTFAGWNMIGNGALVLRNQGIDILLNIFFGVNVNAAKGVCNQVQAAVQQLVGNFTTSVNPQLTRAIATHEQGRTHSLMFHGGKMSFFLMMLMAVPAMVCCNEVMTLWLKDVPEYTVAMVQLTFVYLLSDTLSRFLIHAVLAQGNIKWFQLSIGGLKLVALPVTYLILTLGGSPLSGIIVNIAIDILCISGRLYFTKRLLDFNPQRYIYKVVLPCWGIFIMSFGASYMFYCHLSKSLFIAAPFALAVSLTAIWAMGLDASEKSLLIGYAQKIIK